MSDNASVSKSMRLETSNYSSFLFQAGVLLILRLVVANTDSLSVGLTGGVDDVKSGSLTEFDEADAEGP